MWGKKKYFLSSVFNALPLSSDYENRSSQSACFISRYILHTSVATYGTTILWSLLHIVRRKICGRLKTENDRRISNKCKSKTNSIGAAMLIGFSLHRIHLMPLFLLKLPQALLPATEAYAAKQGVCWKTEDHVAVRMGLTPGMLSSLSSGNLCRGDFSLGCFSHLQLLWIDVPSVFYTCTNAISFSICIPSASNKFWKPCLGCLICMHLIWLYPVLWSIFFKLIQAKA